MDHERMNILLVEDNPGDQVLIKEAIETAGLKARLITSQDGEKGILKAEGLSAKDFVIIDTLLPGIDGFETCQRIRRNNRDVNIIIYTGVIDAVDAAKARTHGADEYCVKTEEGSHLISCIKRILNDA